MRDLRWTCHACGEERPDAQIALMTDSMQVRGVTVRMSQRYCCDRAECAEIAADRVARTLARLGEMGRGEQAGAG